MQEGGGEESVSRGRMRFCYWERRRDGGAAVEKGRGVEKRRGRGKGEGGVIYLV